MTQQWKLVRVNAAFDDLMYWLERCERKGHLDNCADLIEPWEAFDYEDVEETPPASAQDDAENERQAQPINLVHLAVAEDGGVRFMTGRKLPDGVESCELYAMPDYGRAPAELFRAPAAGDARELLEALKEARRELHACQAVIHLAGGFDPAYVTGAQAAIRRADAAIWASQQQEG